MELPYYFVDFLREIRPTPNQRNDCRRGHETLRDRLTADEDLSPIIVSTFLQGSYRRATAIRPKNDKRSDVDVIVVTRLSEAEFTPAEALSVFEPFLEKHYKGKWKPQGRSYAIELTYVDLDLVPTAAPSEAEEGILKSASVLAEATPEDVNDWRLVRSWVPPDQRTSYAAQLLLKSAAAEAEWKLAPLRIPDRDAECWESTHPIAQIQWTHAKNRACNGHYVNIVKALKWWRRVQHPAPPYPKGYPVEHLIGACCPDGVASMAEGVTRSLEVARERYATEAALKTSPFFPDHGVPSHNVFARVSGEDFAEFHEQVSSAAEIARRALDATTERASANAWRELFGNKFPPPPEGDDEEEDGGPKTGGFTARKEVSIIGGGRFA